MTKEIVYLAGPTGLQVHTDESRGPIGLRINALWGPIRSGKSSTAVWRVAEVARREGKKGIAIKALLIRDTFENLRDSTLKTWLEWFPDASNCGYYSESKKNYYLRTDKGKGETIEHEIQFRYGGTAKEASKYLSTDYAIIVGEEVVPAYTPTGMVSPGIAEEVYDMAIMRTCQKGVMAPELVLTFNPPSPQHWVNLRVLQSKDRRIKSFFFPRQENEANLRPGFYEELEELLKGQDTVIARFLRGEILTVYPGVPIYREAFKKEVHTRKTIDYNPDRPLILLFDNPPTPACLVTQTDARGRWNILKEFQGGFVHGRIVENVGQREFCQIIRAEMQQLYPNYKLAPAWGDPALKNPSNTENKTPVNIIQEQFPELQKVGVRYGAVDNQARQESVIQKLNTHQMGQPSILFSEEGCPLLIEGMAGGYRYSVNTDGTRLVGSAPVKNEFSHVCNALEYGCSGLFPAIKYLGSQKDVRYTPPPSAMSA